MLCTSFFQYLKLRGENKKLGCVGGHNNSSTAFNPRRMGMHIFFQCELTWPLSFSYTWKILWPHLDPHFYFYDGTLLHQNDHLFIYLSHSFLWHFSWRSFFGCCLLNAWGHLNPICWCCACCTTCSLAPCSRKINYLQFISIIYRNEVKENYSLPISAKKY